MLSTPHQLRDRITALYMAQFRRAYGIEANREAVERLVIAELGYVDAARHAGALHESSAKAPAAMPAVDKRLLVTPTEERPPALQPQGEQPKDYRPGVLYANPMNIGERWAMAIARIARITEGTAIAATHGQAAETAEMPQLARRFADEYAYFMTRDKPAPTRGVDHNRYRGLSDKDAARAFMRAVEDICDESSAKLGPWRVPK